jgi:RND family efflux transporter MFP subunit
MTIFSYFRRHLVVSTAVVIGAVVIAVIAGRAATAKKVTVAQGGDKVVALVNVGSFRSGSAKVGADGVVESRSQAIIKSQISAPVSRLAVAIGDNVSTGDIILELQNSDIRASLAQAEASLALAKGQYTTGAISLDSARQNALDKIRDAYNKTSDAFLNQAETLLFNIDGKSGRLESYSVDTKLNTEMIDLDIALRAGLREWKTANDKLLITSSMSDIQDVIKIAQKNMTMTDRLLSDMNKILNDNSLIASPTFSASLTTWKSMVSGAQSSVSGANQALTAAQTSLNTANSSQSSSAQAQISVAQAGVSNLQAQLAKTIVRSPLNGKVSALPLREGELASPGILVATVIGKDTGILVKAYISADDLSRVVTGAPAAISSKNSATAATQSQDISGTVSNVSPSVDATTKKAEVVINITDPQRSNLVIGQNVTVSITPPSTSASADSISPVTYILPIQDVKIIPGSAYVFTVDADSKIKKNDVTIGDIQGDYIRVMSGLTDDMNIVSPVYELDEGQKVKTQ